MGSRNKCVHEASWKWTEDVTRDGYRELCLPDGRWRLLPHGHECARGVQLSRVPYPWIPEQLGEHHQVSRGEGEAHVGSSDGEHGHGVVLEELELLAQAVAVC